MRLQRFRSQLSTALWGQRLWSGVTIGLVVANLLLVVHVLTQQSREKTIVVPPGFDQPFSIQGELASPEYLTQVGEWFASLALSYTPKNVDYRIDVFLRYAAPERFSALQRELREEAERIKRNALSAMFFPVDARVRGETVAIVGQHVVRVGQAVIANRRVAYRMRFRLSDRFLHIIEFKEVDHEHPFAADGGAAAAG